MVNYNFFYHFKSLWKIALPLLLSSLSGVAMVFVDRLILAQYNMEAHNASVEATNIGWAFIAAISTLAGISQVFVSQNTGAKQDNQIGKFVWQTIWFCLVSTMFFIAAALICPKWIFGSDASCEMQRNYLSYMLYFAPAHGLFAAICGFYIGRGRTFFPTCVVLAGNVVNASLCYVFVFGIKGIVPSFGVTGAALAMNVAVSIQVVILVIDFLSRKNRKTYATDNWRIDLPILKKSLYVGLPSSFFTVLEITGWGIFYKMMSSLSQGHLTVAGIVQNILILSFFFNEGLSRAVTAKVGQAIGAKEFPSIQRIVLAGFLSVFFFILVLAIVLWFYHDNLINLFLATLSEQEGSLLYPALIFGCINAVIYKALEGVRMVAAGALLAAADTIFLLTIGTACVWLGMVLPIYYFVYLPQGSIEKALVLCSVYTLIGAVVYLYRFYSNAWQSSAVLIGDSPASKVPASR